MAEQHQERVEPQLDRDRREHYEQGPPPEQMQALFDEIAGETVDRAPGPRERLRQLPTVWRVLAAVVASVGVAMGALALLGVRPTPDSTRGLAGYVATLSCLVGMVALAVALSLRGLHQRPAARWAWGVTLVALLLPLGLMWIPAIWARPSGAGAASGLGLRCLMLGLLTAAVVGAVVRLFQRSDRPPDWRLGTMAGAGGLVAFAMVQLQCPASDPLHLVLGHGLAGILLAGVLLLAARLRDGGDRST